MMMRRRISLIRKSNGVMMSKTLVMVMRKKKTAGETITSETMTDNPVPAPQVPAQVQVRSQLRDVNDCQVRKGYHRLMHRLILVQNHRLHQNQLSRFDESKGRRCSSR
jgi:hypothetical protein